MFVVLANIHHTKMPCRASSKMGMEREEMCHQKVEKVLCMKGGDGETSYAKNSNFQRKVISSVRHILEESAKELCTTFLFGDSQCQTLTVADLGCATGPNALLALSNFVNIVCKTCEDTGRKSPSFLVFLNDLPSNDLNTIFKSLNDFYDPMRKDGRECFVAATPGSFHGRLFPSKSLHFAHSSYTLHWLSQVPEGLTDGNGEALNKGNIYIGETSSLAVQAAYADQFKKDFSAFLKSRSEELILGGSMVMTFNGNVRANAPFKIYDVICQSLADMIKEGLINESKLDKFNLPCHMASTEQIIEAILYEGSFEIRRLEIIKTAWDGGRESGDRGEFVATYMRAVLETLLVAGFGEGVLDELFGRAGVKFTELMNAEDCQYHNIVVWLTRK